MSTSGVQPRAGRNFFYIRQALRLRIPLAIATMVFALAGLVANLANVDLLLRPLGERSATHPITALCLFGIGLGILRLKRFGQSPTWRLMLAGTILMICAGRIMESVITAWTGAASLSIFGPIGAFHGRFSIEAAMVLGAFAAAALLRQRSGRWGMVYLVVGLAVVFNILLEISYGLTFFNGDVSAFTLLSLGVVALAMVTVYIHRPFARVLFLVGEIGSQTRVMAATAIAIPWACGYFLHTFKDISGNSAPFEAGMISVITWSMLVILMTTSARHEGSDAARRRAEREIAMISRTDPVTKALNRFGMFETLEGAWLEYRSAGSLFGMVLVDLDYFKRINETFGHDAVDDVLARVGATIHPQLRDSDAFGRWGGEEFLILLKIKNRGDVGIVADRLREALEDIESPFCEGLDGLPARITASFGISEMNDEDDGPTDAIKRAETELAFAKDAVRTSMPTKNAFIEDAEAGLIFPESSEDDDDDRAVIAA